MKWRNVRYAPAHVSRGRREVGGGGGQGREARVGYDNLFSHHAGFDFFWWFGTDHLYAQGHWSLKNEHVWSFFRNVSKTFKTLSIC